MHKAGKAILLFAQVCMLMLSLAGKSLAGPCDTVIISAVDTSNFPNITVDVGCLPDTVLELGTQDYQVIENGNVLPVSSIETYQAPLQLAFVLDVAGNIDAPGASGEDVRIEFLKAIEDFVLTDKTVDRTSRTDQVMLVAPEGADAARTVLTWSNDYNDLRNKVLDELNGTPPGHTALKSMLMDTLAQMNDWAGWETNSLAVIVLSDGVDTTSAEEITDVINRATAVNVALYTIKVGPNEKGDASALQRMAKLTGGVYTAYTGEGSLDSIHEGLNAVRSRVQVGYHSTVSQQGSHGTALRVVSQGHTYTSQEYRWSVNLLPPTVTVTQPANGLVVRRVAESWDADPKLVEPTELALAIRIGFPDDHLREITRIVLLANGVAQELDSSRPVWQMTDTQPGDWPYTLIVQAQDELGLVGESAPITVVVQLQIPAAPICRPGDWGCLVKKNANWLAIGALAIALVVVTVTKRRAVVQIANTMGQKIKDTVAAVGGKSRKPLAFLVATDAAGNPTERYAIVNPKTTIGRDRQLAALTLDDETVSKYHAQLLQNRESGFLINDEGSSNGTYVNDQRLGFEPVALNDNDVIYFGQYRVVFRLAHDGEYEADTVLNEAGRFTSEKVNNMPPLGDDDQSHYTQKDTQRYDRPSDWGAGPHH